MPTHDPRTTDAGCAVRLDCRSDGHDVPTHGVVATTSAVTREVGIGHGVIVPVLHAPIPGRVEPMPRFRCVALGHGVHETGRLPTCDRMCGEVPHCHHLRSATHHACGALKINGTPRVPRATRTGPRAPVRNRQVRRFISYKRRPYPPARRNAEWSPRQANRDSTCAAMSHPCAILEDGTRTSEREGVAHNGKTRQLRT